LSIAIFSTLYQYDLWYDYQKEVSQMLKKIWEKIKKYFKADDDYHNRELTDEEKDKFMDGHW